MKLQKIVMFSLITVFALAGMTAGETVFFEDNFDSYSTVTDANLSQISGVWSTDPWFLGSSRYVKVGSNWPGQAYYSNNYYGDTEMRLAEADTGEELTDYTVIVDAYWHETWPCNMYAAARISGADDSNYIAAGATVGGGAVYAKAKDSAGNSFGDDYIAEYDANEPIEIKLSVNGSNVSATITHVNLSHTYNFTTTVTEPGSPGFGGQINYAIDGSKAYFDNFKVTGIACGDPGTLTLAGDINGDCYVDLADFAKLALNWAKCSDPADSNCDMYW